MYSILHVSVNYTWQLYMATILLKLLLFCIILMHARENCWAMNKFGFIHDYCFKLEAQLAWTRVLHQFLLFLEYFFYEITKPYCIIMTQSVRRELALNSSSCTDIALCMKHGAFIFYSLLAPRVWCMVIDNIIHSVDRVQRFSSSGDEDQARREYCISAFFTNTSQLVVLWVL